MDGTENVSFHPHFPKLAESDKGERRRHWNELETSWLKWHDFRRETTPFHFLCEWAHGERISVRLELLRLNWRQLIFLHSSPTQQKYRYGLNELNVGNDHGESLASFGCISLVVWDDWEIITIILLSKWLSALSISSSLPSQIRASIRAVGISAELGMKGPLMYPTKKGSCKRGYQINPQHGSPNVII